MADLKAWRTLRRRQAAAIGASLVLGLQAVFAALAQSQERSAPPFYADKMDLLAYLDAQGRNTR